MKLWNYLAVAAVVLSIGTIVVPVFLSVAEFEIVAHDAEAAQTAFLEETNALMASMADTATCGSHPLSEAAYAMSAAVADIMDAATRTRWLSSALTTESWMDTLEQLVLFANTSATSSFNATLWRRVVAIPLRRLLSMTQWDTQQTFSVFLVETAPDGATTPSVSSFQYLMNQRGRVRTLSCNATVCFFMSLRQELSQGRPFVCVLPWASSSVAAPTCTSTLPPWSGDSVNGSGDGRYHAFIAGGRLFPLHFFSTASVSPTNSTTTAAWFVPPSNPLLDAVALLSLSSPSEPVDASTSSLGVVVPLDGVAVVGVWGNLAESSLAKWLSLCSSGFNDQPFDALAAATRDSCSSVASPTAICWPDASTWQSSCGSVPVASLPFLATFTASFGGLNSDHTSLQWNFVGMKRNRTAVDSAGNPLMITVAPPPLTVVVCSATVNGRRAYYDSAVWDFVASHSLKHLASAWALTPPAAHAVIGIVMAILSLIPMYLTSRYAAEHIEIVSTFILDYLSSPQAVDEEVEFEVEETISMPLTLTWNYFWIYELGHIWTNWGNAMEAMMLMLQCVPEDIRNTVLSGAPFPSNALAAALSDRGSQPRQTPDEDDAVSLSASGHRKPATTPPAGTQEATAGGGSGANNSSGNVETASSVPSSSRVVTRHGIGISGRSSPKTAAVLVVNVQDFHHVLATQAENSNNLIKMYVELQEALLQSSRMHGGHLSTFHGDRFILTFEPPQTATTTSATTASTVVAPTTVTLLGSHGATQLHGSTECEVQKAVESDNKKHALRLAARAAAWSAMELQQLLFSIGRVSLVITGGTVLEGVFGSELMRRSHVIGPAVSVAMEVLRATRRLSRMGYASCFTVDNLFDALESVCAVEIVGMLRSQQLSNGVLLPRAHHLASLSDQLASPSAVVPSPTIGTSNDDMGTMSSFERSSNSNVLPHWHGAIHTNSNSDAIQHQHAAQQGGTTFPLLIGAITALSLAEKDVSALRRGSQSLPSAAIAALGSGSTNASAAVFEEGGDEPSRKLSADKVMDEYWKELISPNPFDGHNTVMRLLCDGRIDDAKSMLRKLKVTLEKRYRKGGTSSTNDRSPANQTEAVRSVPPAVAAATRRLEQLCYFTTAAADDNNKRKSLPWELE